MIGLERMMGLDLRFLKIGGNIVYIRSGSALESILKRIGLYVGIRSMTRLESMVWRIGRYGWIR